MGKPNVVNLFADVDCGEHNIFICVFIIAKGAMMDIENRATKIMLKNMPVFLAEELIALYKIKTPYKLMEMGEVADMLKDLSEVEKNLAKAHHYETECPRYEDKKY